MKKLFPLILLGLFCIAGIVLAAPGRLIGYTRPVRTLWQLTDSRKTTDTLPTENTIKPSLLEGTARFACW